MTSSRSNQIFRSSLKACRTRRHRMWSPAPAIVRSSRRASQLAAMHAICADPPGVDRGAFHQRLNAAVVAFLTTLGAR